MNTTIEQKAIANFLDTITSKSKVDWSKSKFLPIKNSNNQAKGKFGEFVIKEVYNGTRVNSNGYDVETPDGWKVEVKTAFQGANEGFWFNQIYDTKNFPQKINKDFTHLAFVFVFPDEIKAFILERPEDLYDYFSTGSTGNGFELKGKYNNLCKKLNNHWIECDLTN